MVSEEYEGSRLVNVIRFNPRSMSDIDFAIWELERLKEGLPLYVEEQGNDGETVESKKDE